jgi:transposase
MYMALFIPDIYLGCRLLFLPPYSPDFNPIEEAFASMKAYLWRNFTDTSLMSIVHAFARITPEMAAGWFCNSGYIV